MINKKTKYQGPAFKFHEDFIVLLRNKEVEGLINTENTLIDKRLYIRKYYFSLNCSKNYIKSSQDQSKSVYLWRCVSVPMSVLTRQLYKLYQKYENQANIMASWVKQLPAKPEDLNSIPASHVVRGGVWPLKAALWPSHASSPVLTCMCKCKNKFQLGYSF